MGGSNGGYSLAVVNICLIGIGGAVIVLVMRPDMDVKSICIVSGAFATIIGAAIHGSWGLMKNIDKKGSCRDSE